MRHTTDISTTFSPSNMMPEEIKEELQPIYNRVAHEQKMKKILYGGLMLTATTMAAGGYLALRVWNELYK